MYLKEARCNSRFVHIVKGALLWPRTSVPCICALSACCFTRRRTVVALSLGSGYDPGGYRHLRLELHTASTEHVTAGPWSAAAPRV